jgi:ABC-type sugar transport system ATPase subunit
MLSTLVRPTSGQALVAGHDIARSAVKVRAAIGVVFQDSALDRTLSVWENLRFAGMLAGSHGLREGPRRVEVNRRKPNKPAPGRNPNGTVGRRRETLRWEGPLATEGSLS